jgi:hypothetical protein
MVKYFTEDAFLHVHVLVLGVEPLQVHIVIAVFRYARHRHDGGLMSEWFDERQRQ